MIQNIFITISAFIGMEFIALASHKYVMHGFLWYLHEDHHVLTGKPLQKNDSFALIFAIPSALGFILEVYIIIIFFFILALVYSFMALHIYLFMIFLYTEE